MPSESCLVEFFVINCFSLKKVFNLMEKTLQIAVNLLLIRMDIFIENKCANLFVIKDFLG